MKAHHHIALYPDSRPLTLTMTPPGTPSVCEDALETQGLWRGVPALHLGDITRLPWIVPYIDDILVYGKTKEEHDRNLERVLRVLHVCHFHLQLTKCRFYQKTVKYLGHFLSGSEL